MEKNDQYATGRVQVKNDANHIGGSDVCVMSARHAWMQNSLSLSFLNPSGMQDH